MRFLRPLPTLFFVLAATAAISACKQRNFNARQSSSVAGGTKPSFVILQCIAPQGNGGNWGSTLGWVSEEWMLRADQAEEAEGAGGHSKDSSLINLACAAGGSSGSGVTNVTMALLKNEFLFPGDDAGRKRRAKGFYTPSETRVLARALRYIAMGVDLNGAETADFALLLIEQTLLAKAEGSNVLQTIDGFFRKVRQRVGGFEKEQSVCSNTLGVRWWSGQAAEPCDAVVNFGKYAWLGKNITRAMIDDSVDALGEYAVLARQTKMQVISDLPLLGTVLRVKDTPGLLPSFQNPSYEMLVKLGGKQSVVMGSKLDALLSSKTPAHFKDIFGSNTFNHRQFPKVVVEGAKFAGPDAHPISADILAMAPSTGFYTITTATVTPKGRFDPKALPRYEDIRYVVFGNEETMRLIAGSALLKEHLKDPACAARKPEAQLDPCLPRRFFLAVVDKNLYTMQPSVREPDLMEELATPAYAPGAFGAQHMGIVKFLDLAEATSAGMPEFKATTGGVGENLIFSVTGGWPDRRITAWPQGYIVDSRLAGEWKSEIGGVPAVVFHSTFGKPDTDGGSSTTSSVAPGQRSTAESADKFDTKAVRAFFSKDGAGQAEKERGQRNVIDYVGMQNAYYALVGPKALTKATGVPNVHSETTINWDITRIPAFLVGKSRHLVTLSANAVREGIVTGEKGEVQECQVVSSQTLGRSQCSRLVLPGEVNLGGKGLLAINEAVKERSSVTFNPADPRIMDPEAEAKVKGAKGE